MKKTKAGAHRGGGLSREQDTCECGEEANRQLTLLILPGDGGLGPAHRQAVQVHVLPLVHRDVLRDVDDSGRH